MVLKGGGARTAGKCVESNTLHKSKKTKTTRLNNKRRKFSRYMKITNKLNKIINISSQCSLLLRKKQKR
jgi:hypothetical protein